MMIYDQVFKHLVDGAMMAEVNELIKKAIASGGGITAAAAASSSSGSGGAKGDTDKMGVLSFF